MSINKEVSKRLYYFSMFDGHLQKRFETGNARLSISMNCEHVEYIAAVADTLETAGIGYSISESDRRSENPNRTPQLRLQSKSHPFLTRIWERMYINKHKVVDLHMIALLDAEALAIAFMADGGRYVDKKWAATPQYVLHTNGLSYGDNFVLKKALKDKFNLEFNIDKKNQYFQLRLRRPDSKAFEELISEFVFPSFYYKLGRQTPEKDDDIVCSAVKAAEVGRNDQPSRIDASKIVINK